MLHPDILHELLEDEMAVARTRVGDRLRGLSLVGSCVVARVPGPTGAEVCIELDGSQFDAEPFHVAVKRNGQFVQPHEWPQFVFGSLHPVLERPFICIRGTYEYHCHPSHLMDAWDRYRTSIRLVDLLEHMLGKNGR
jgi:hypothetical protein